MKAPDDLTKEQLIRDLTELRSRIGELEQSEEDKRKYQEELSRTKAMFEGLFEFAPDAIIVVKRDGTIARANKQAEKLFGYSRSELLNVHHEILMPERFREKHMEHRRKYMSEPRIRPMGTGLELYGRRKDGSEFAVDIALGPLKTEEDMVVLAVIRDVSQRTQAEMKMAHLASFPELNPNPIVETDLEGRVTYINPVIKERFPDLEKKGLAHPLFSEWHDLIGQMVREEKISLSREITVNETAYHQIIHYSPEMRFVRIYNVDISERKRTEEALKESESRLRGIASAALDAVILIDNDGNVSFWNDAATRIFGYTNEEIIGKYLHSFIMPERHIDTFRRGFEAFRSTGQGPFIGTAYEIEAKRKDGTEFPVELSLAALELKGKWNAIGIVREITERKRAEDQLNRSKKLSETLNDLNAVIHSTLDVNAIMQRVVTDAIKFEDIDAATIGLFEADSFVFRYAHNFPAELLNRPFSRTELKGIYYSASVRDVVVFEDARHDERLNTRFWERYNVRSLMIAPLAVRGKVIGALSFYCFKLRVICSSEHADFARKLASSVSLALENANLFDDLKRMEAQMTHMAYHDPLTGLPNRRLLIDIAGIEMAQANRNGKKLALLFMDLDRFKEINDTLGHEVGDELLKEVASRLKAQIRASDSVARIGGDEFNIIMADIIRPEDTTVLVQKILESVRQRYFIAGHDLHLSASVGISIYPDDSDEMDTLFRYADIAMYHAKELGRNTFQFFNSDINVLTVERMKMEGWLRQAIERGELTVHYQPQINIRTKKIVCAEALVRWQHPELGLLEPKRFVPLAEEIGFITSIDEWVMRNVCAQSAEWQKAGMPPVCITVNLSARQFLNPELVDTVSQILDETDMDPDCLDIEITESLAMKNIDHTATRLKELVEMGVHISIDDFGTGYSSLNYLKRLPIERLKIDQSFIQDIATDPDDRAIINAVTAMAHNMKIKVIAEGVETEDQLSFVHSSGCDEVQGYLFSRPLPPKEFREYYSSATL